MNRELAKAIRRAQAERWEGTLLVQLRAAGLPLPVQQVEVDPTRKWRWDCCWPEHSILLDIQGGTWMKGGGGHNRGRGYQNDQDKANEATLAGFRVLHVTGDDVESGRALRLIERALRLFGKEDA